MRDQLTVQRISDDLVEGLLVALELAEHLLHLIDMLLELGNLRLLLALQPLLFLLELPS